MSKPDDCQFIFVWYIFTSLQHKSISNMKNIILLVLLFSGICKIALAGNYVEFKISFVPGKQAAKEEDAEIMKSFMGNRTMKSWFSDGNIRFESEPILSKDMTNRDVPSGFMDRLNKPMVSISLKSDPNKTFHIDESDKSYTVIEMAAISKEKNEENYVITELGKEKVNGYVCKHLLVKENRGKSTFHLWITEELKGFSEFMKMSSKMQIKDGMYKALEEKKIKGMMVKLKGGDINGDGEFVMDLVKMEEVNVPASKFSLSGYKRKDVAAFNPMGAGSGEELSAEEKKMILDAVKGDASQIEFMENMIKKMPAAQRKMMIEQMVKSLKDRD